MRSRSFAAAVGLATEAGKWFLGECLELRYRLPRHWDMLTSGQVPAWKARRVARETLRLSPEAAGFVDQNVAPVAGKIRPAQLDRTIHEAIGRYMPEEVERLAAASWDKRHLTIHDQLVSFTGTMRIDAELDIADALDLEAAVAAGAQQRADLGSGESLDVRRAQAVGDLARGQHPLDLHPAQDAGADARDERRIPRVRPRQVVLHVHLSHAALQDPSVSRGLDPIARLERGNALVSVEQVRVWCGRPDTGQVVVKPVLDLDTCTTSESDTVSEPIKEQVALRDHTCVFPWCTRPARSCHPEAPNDHPCDNDHVIPRARNGPTCSCNITPLCRRHHRLKTHTPWSNVVIDPGTYLWTSPHGYQFLRDPHGTLDITTDRPRPKPPDT